MIWTYKKCLEIFSIFMYMAKMPRPSKKYKRSRKTRKGKLDKTFNEKLVRAPKMSRFAPYPYKFSLLPCILTADRIVPGLIRWQTTPATQVSQNPFNNAGTSSTVNSATNFTDFYDFGFSANFRLTDLQSYPQFNAMYDAYRIRRVDCHIEYLNNMSIVNSGGLLPTIYLYNDQDDAVPPTDLRQLMGKEGVRRKLLAGDGKVSFSHSIIPRTSTLLSDSVGNGRGVNKPDQWINCVDGGVSHFSLKAYITDFYAPGLSTVSQAFKFSFIYHVEFRAPLLTY